jgi:hypothetical protein
LNVDPVPRLLASGHPAIVAWTRHDLLGDADVRASDLMQLPQATRIIERQLPDGRWRYHNPKPGVRPEQDYDQLETLRQLSVLVNEYGADRAHPAVRAARKFLTGFQTQAGDFRGIYGRQYSPNYTASITEVLIRAGYGASPEVGRALRWLRSMRQDDGGWAIPTRTRGRLLDVMRTGREPMEPDRSRPSAHLVTGIVLRAFAAHPGLRGDPAALQAADWLSGRLFTKDNYSDHEAATYWLIFSYPFWWTDLLSSMDTLVRLGFTIADERFAQGVQWFVDKQEPGGFWNTGRNRPKDRFTDEWVALAVCRLLSRV